MVAALLVLIIGLPTYVVPGETETLFSWTVTPPLTAAFLGGGYLTSMFVELLASRERRWANARIAIPAVLLFTVLTAVVTLRHLDKFHFGADHSMLTQLITWVWLIVYLVVPPLLGYLWWQQVRGPVADPPRSHRFPAPVRVVLAAQALVVTAVGACLYVAPEDLADDLWPWSLSALTGGAVGAWLLGVGVGVGHTLWENDLRRVRPWMVAYALFGTLEIVAVLRYAADENPAGETIIDWSGPRVWIYLVIAASMVAVAGWVLRAESRTGLA